MFDEREALVAAVAANPDDDTPRLVFADWLQEHGEDDRAEFIRLECELAVRHMEYATDSSLPEDFKAARKVAGNLLVRKRQRWFGDFFRALGTEEVWLGSQSLGRRLWNRIVGEPRHTSHYVDFVHGGQATIMVNGDGPVARLLVRCGFMDHVEFNFASRFAIPDLTTAFALEPVRSLRISFSPNPLAWKSIDLPCLHRITTLGFHLPSHHGRKETAAFEQLLETDNWSGMRELHCWSPNYEPRGIPSGYVEQLARSPLLSRVKNLTISIGLDGLRRLASSHQTMHIQSISLWGCDLQPESADVLRKAVFRPNLQSLDASLNHLGDDGARRLAAGGAWPSLRSLDLGCNQISDAGVQELLPLIAQLKHLSLCSGSITDAGALAIANAIDPTKLESLSLSYNPLSPEVVGQLRERFGERFLFTTREEDEERRRLGG